MSSCDLSILCVTRAEPHALRFLTEMSTLAKNLGAECVIAADGAEATNTLRRSPDVVRRVDSAGYLESVLEQALSFCSRDYVLRLDDDEACAPGMVRWLTARGYEGANHWKFSRVHLWESEHLALVTPQLWPDMQTRLSVMHLAGSRSSIHAGSPFGGGHEAPCSIVHWKFVVKSLEERRAVVARYDRIQEGAGSSFRPFSCPEDFYKPEEIAANVRGWDGETFTRRAA